LSYGDVTSHFDPHPNLLPAGERWVSGG